MRESDVASSNVMKMKTDLTKSSSLARGKCQMPSSAPVGQVVFLRVLGPVFRQPLVNDRLDIGEIFLKGP